MSSVHKPSTSSEKVIIEEDGKDRINELADEILVHILSFLPTKSVVATSLISPRWRNLWASVPVLDFDDRSHWQYLDVNAPLPYCISYGLMNFVDKVLLLHEFSSLSKFRLKCRGRFDMSRFNAWIIHAVKHLIQEIDVQILLYDSLFMYLPQSLCTSNTLVVLRLGPKLAIQLPTSVWFPSLKILEISFLYLGNDMIQKLLCSCPTLENLMVNASLRFTEMVLNVAIPTLKRLKIVLQEDEDGPQHNGQNNGYKILLDTPSLENLSLYDQFLAWYSLKNMSSLVKASFGIGQFQSIFETEEHANRVHDIIRGLFTVKFLSLSGDVTKVLSTGAAADDNNLPMFYNLIHMDMPIRINMDMPLLLKLLKNMPSLERLELSIEYTEDCNEEKFISAASQEVPSCLVSHLKEIKVSEFEECDEDMKLVEYLLKNAKVLEKITLDSSHIRNLEEKKRLKKLLKKKLLSLPKGSKTCRIKFFEKF